jgi:cellulose synthase/poly-beta-1,6-N-acetylglucosamine synthase-like glycosyltransferase
LIAFLLLGFALFYIVAGYPLLAGWMARRWPRPVRTGPELRTVSVIVPVHNGARFLADKLDSILDLDYPRELLEIIVVDDGSSDETATIARSYAARGVRLLQQPKSGKPAALNLGIPQASGEILLLTDVRQALAKDSLRHLIACFADPQVGAASGDLIVRQGDREESTVGIYWRYERWIRKNLGQIDSIFGATGPFYALRRSLAVPIPPDVLLDDMYLPLAAFFQGYRLIVDERAVAYDYPTSLETEFGRKVRTLAGNYQLLRYYPRLLGFRNRMLFHFLSYKIARLLMPWIALAFLLSAFALPRPFDWIVIAAEAGFFILAALDSAVPPKSFLKRLTSPPRTVVSLLSATVVALQIFFVPPQKLWKPTRIRLNAPESTAADRRS